MSKVKCPSCGAMSSSPKFCSECGAPLFAVNNTKPAPVSTPQPSYKPSFNIEDAISFDGAVMDSTVRNSNTTVSDKGLKLLVDCCRTRVATVGGDGYSEYVLYERSENEYELHYYSKYASDPQETHFAYKATKAVADEVNRYLRTANLQQYDGKDSGLFGGDFIVKYLMDGEIHRLSLSSFDYDHKSELYKVEQIITSCAKEENKLP